MHAEPLKGANVQAQLCKGGGAEVGTHVDMHTCTDTYTHSNIGVVLEDGPLDKTQEATHGCTQLCKWDVKSQMNMSTCTEACTHSNQVVG